MKDHQIQKAIDANSIVGTIAPMVRVHGLSEKRTKIIEGLFGLISGAAVAFFGFVFFFSS
jgi:hypothetical protein